MKTYKQTLLQRWMYQLRQRRESLLIALVEKAQADGLTQQELAQQLGVVDAYLGELFSGASRVENITQATAQSMAAFLHWPVIYVMLTAGKLRLEDFFTETHLERLSVQAGERWHELQGASPLCAVRALVLCDEPVMKRNALRDIAVAGMGYTLN